LIQFQWGKHQISVLDAGSLWLDGGAMFGVVPKVLWERERTPDAKNRIQLAMNLLLIDDGKRRILVDSGAGTKWSDKQRKIYGLDTRTATEILAPAGFGPDQIDLVVNTHLHFDHAGGNTVIGNRGQLESAFPNARFVMQKGELEMAGWQNERIQASYQTENFEPLKTEAERLWLLEGDSSLGAGVSVLVAPGHTPHMQLILVDSGDETLAFMADLIPTTSHIRYPYIMGYDLEPLKTLETKKRVLPRAVTEKWRLVFQHDTTTKVATLEEVAGHLTPRDVELTC
jgi:glyoxylase-like metal-dependent hydrolase (beta-lactamase superfamily II)